MQDLMHAGWANKRPQGGIDAMCNSSVCKWSGKAIAKDCAGGEHGRTRKSAADEVELDLEALKGRCRSLDKPSLSWGWTRAQWQRDDDAKRNIFGIFPCCLFTD